MTRHLWLAGTRLPIAWPHVITFADPGGWDARRHACMRVVTPAEARRWRPAPACDPGGRDRLDDDLGDPGCSGGVATGTGPSDAHRVNRYSHRAGCRDLTGDALRRAVEARVRQVVVHHDGCTSSAMCFHVLHNERGLSCHLLIDNDGTIYQTLDLALAAWHARGHNDISIGVELCSRGDKDATVGACDRWGRRPSTCTIHGVTLLAWGYTDAQLQAMVALAGWVSRYLPGVPLDFPRDPAGRQAAGLIAAPYSFAGWLGHYHTTTRKWDPGPFDFEGLIRAAGAAVYYPVTPGPPGDRARPVADDADARRRDLDALYAANEDARCGLFPAGPWCQYRLWHGGAHLPAARAAPVHAALPGRLVAARAGRDGGAGSTGFALIRHDLLGRGRSVYTLYYHLDPRPDAWPARWAAPVLADPDRVVLLDVPVAGGEPLGVVGPAGPAGAPQLHFEVFSVGRVDDDWFTLVEGARDSRFCDDPALQAALGDPDPPFDPDAIAAAYRAAPALRRVVTRSCSEWSPTCGGDDWTSALAARPTDVDRADLAALVAAQIDPGLWWTDEVGAALGLPRDGYVYHYHPITFLAWVADWWAARAADARRRRLDPVTPGPNPFSDDTGADARAQAYDAREENDDYARCRDQLDLDQVVGGHDGARGCWPWSTD